jgi:hypothetical protein
MKNKLATEFEDTPETYTVQISEQLTVGRLMEAIKDQSPDTLVALVDWDRGELNYLHNIGVRKVIWIAKTEQEYILSRDQEEDHPEYLRRQVEEEVEPMPYPVVVLC